MKKEIRIHHFGPIDDFSIDMNKGMTVLIGTQASGKSTISKTIYFCLKIKTYLFDFLNDIQSLTNNHPNEYYSSFMKYLRGKFIAIFGTTKHMRKFNIRYQFDDYYVSIDLGEDKYVYFNFSNELKYKIRNVIKDYATLFLDATGKSLTDFIANAKTLNLFKMKLSQEISEIFCDEREIIYIPAGRSLLATLSERLHEIQLKDIDLTMLDFIELINNTRHKFGMKIPDMVTDYVKTVKGQIKNDAVQSAYSLIKRILRADYVSDTDGEKMYFDDVHWVKLIFASSGQQEALWILMLLFCIILENKCTFIITEEPEAHLFPMAQKYIVELMALCRNTTNSSMLITTHSPYILTSMNVLLHSNKVENNPKTKAAKTIINKQYRLNYNSFSAFYIKAAMHNSEIKSLLDDETNVMDTTFIDSVSEVTNEELDALIDLEVEYDL